MRVAHFYLMKDEPERVRAVAPRHAVYWHDLALPGYLGGPFGDRSGGLILFDIDSFDDAEQLVANDPFVRDGLVSSRWTKPWVPE